jgi:hypothetical protein
MTVAAMPWSTRLWPSVEDAAPSPLVPLLAVGVGALAALTLRFEALGAAVPVVGAAALAVALGTRRRRPTAAQLLTAAAACALLAVCALRGAEWLVVLCLLGGWAVAMLSLVGGRTWTGIVLAGLVAALAPVRTLRWLIPVLGRFRPPGAAASRVALVAIVSVGLVVPFAALFAAADPAYASLLRAIIPDTGLPDVVRRLVVLAGVTGGVLVAAHLSHLPPAVDALAPPPGRPVRRWEWAVPLVVLDLLFLSFVLVQLSVLFGGRTHVLSSRGLTYAEYARQGFWQLLVVTVLTLVVAVAVRTASTTTTGQRMLTRALLGVLCLLALVVVGSAMHRMWLYQQEYGFTRLRLFVDTVELVLGAVFVLLLAAGLRLSGSWLPRAVVALVTVSLLVLAAVNPDAWIAGHNVRRFADTGRLDVAYLSTLSADAVPALLKLPAPQRACALGPLVAALSRTDDPWFDANLARSRARRLLADQPAGVCRIAVR